MVFLYNKKPYIIELYIVDSNSLKLLISKYKNMIISILLSNCYLI